MTTSGSSDQTKHSLLSYDVRPVLWVSMSVLIVYFVVKLKCLSQLFILCRKFRCLPFKLVVFCYMENYGTNYLNNSFGHEFNENFVENYHQHEQHQPKSQYEVPLQGAMFEYDGVGMSANNQVN